jgi:DNA-binding NtrC family response regulator
MDRIMLIEDEVFQAQSLLMALRKRFESPTLKVECHRDPQEALRRAYEASFAVVISDFRMPNMDGVEFLKRFRAIQPDAVRLMLTAMSDFQTALTAINDAEVFRFIRKPWSEDGTVAVGEALVRHAQLIEERHLADEQRLKRGELTPAELELKRLEESEPGITKVKWGPDGSVLLDDD